MKIQANGKEEILQEEMSLLSFIQYKELIPEKVVIEYNYDIVPRERWDEIYLKEADHIEVLSFVGGG